MDSYGGSLRYRVRYELARGSLEPVQRPDVVLVGAGHRLLSRGHTPTQPGVPNQRQVQFSEVRGACSLGAGGDGGTGWAGSDARPAPPHPASVPHQEHWVHESSRPVQRAEMLQVLQGLEAVLIQTVYDHRMASVGLSDVAMDTTVTYATSHGRAHSVEECRCLTQPGWGLQRPCRGRGETTRLRGPCSRSLGSVPADAPSAIPACPVRAVTPTSLGCPGGPTWAPALAATAMATPALVTLCMATAW